MNSNTKTNKLPLFGADRGTFVYLIAIAANILVQFVVSVIILANGALNAKAMFHLAIMIVLQIGYVTTYYILVVKGKYAKPEFYPSNFFKNDTANIDTVKNITVKSKVIKTCIYLGIAIVLAFVTIITFYAPTYWFAVLLQVTGFKPSASVVMSTPAQFVVGIIAMVIAAPIGEELIFRSALLSGLKTVTTNKKAVIFSALAFMLMHMNPTQTIYQFCLGVVLAIAVLITKKPIVSIFIHAFSNIFAILIDYTPINIAVNNMLVYLSNHIAIAIVLSIAAVAVGIVMLFFVFKLLKKIEGKSKAANTSVNINDKADTNAGITVPKSDIKVVESKQLTYKLYYLIAVSSCLFAYISVLVTGYMPVA